MARVRQQATTRNRRVVARNNRGSPPSLTPIVSWEPTVPNAITLTFGAEQQWLIIPTPVASLNGGPVELVTAAGSGFDINLVVPWTLTVGDVINFPDEQQAIQNSWGQRIAGFSWTVPPAPTPPALIPPWSWVVFQLIGGTGIEIVADPIRGPFTFTRNLPLWWLPGPGSPGQAPAPVVSQVNIGGGHISVDFGVSLVVDDCIAVGTDYLAVTASDGAGMQPGIWRVGTPVGPPF